MKVTHFFLISALVPSISQAMHIENSSTKIKFNGKKRTISEWIRDERDKEFGDTTIIVTTTNQPPFIKKSKVKNLEPENFSLIAEGYSFYCNNIKKKNDIAYGSIVINPEMYHFDKTTAQKVYECLRNTYIEKQLRKSQIDGIKLEPHTSDSSDAQEDSTKRKRKWSKSRI